MFGKKEIRTFCFLFFLVIFSAPVVSQVTKIMGKVVDAESQLPIPFANIFFKGTTIGVTSDFDGNFSIETKSPKDSLTASCMSYNIQTVKVFENRFQEINFELKSAEFDLPEVIILAGENPADILLRKIIENKEQNNRKEFDAYQYESYNKIQIDANNLNEKFRNRRILKPFNFIFDYVDTSTVNGKTYLPIFLAETISEFYFRKDPKSEKEVIKAANVSGIDNESMLQFLGEMFQRYDFYDNYITIFQKNFVSPISNSALNTYRFYLVDSAFIKNKWCYKLMFKPRRKQELTFTGHFWVHDSTYAIKSFDIKIAEDANINFVNDLVLRQEFELIDGKYWMVVKDQGVGDFNILENSKKAIGFFGTKTSTYRNFVFNQLMDRKFYSHPTNVIVSDKAYEKGKEYWDQSRHEPLSKDESTIYYMVDTLKNLPAVKTWIDIFRTIVRGYYDVGKFEIGPYSSMISFNDIEGARFLIGGRTTTKFSEQIRLDGHVAYGTRDKVFKYGIGFLFLPNKNPRRAIGGNYEYEIEQLGASPDAFREDFFFNVFFRRSPANKLSMTNQYSIYYEHEWFNGFSNRLTFIQKEIIPIGSESIQVYNEYRNVDTLANINTSEFKLDTRFAYDEKFLIGDFERISTGTHYPIVHISYSLGVPDLFGGDYGYQKLAIGVKQWFNVFSLGWSKYIIEAGKVWGTLPFPLLRLHPGNETYIFDEYAFNLMNYFEFVSDEYLSIYYTHHFDGLFFNHIPLLRKLKWREVGYVRTVIGTMSEENKRYNKLPPLTFTLENPYFEGGVGIENIFKIIRIDAIWRFSHFNHPEINKFGIFVSLYFSF